MLSGDTEVFVGWDALTARTDLIDALHTTIGTPVDARLPWLEIWATVHPDRDLTTIATYGPDGALDGLAPLAQRSIGPFRSIVAVGQGFADRSSVIWRDPAAATRLGCAVRSGLADLHRPWQLWLERLTPGPGLDAFADALGSVHELEPGPESPQIAFGADRDPRRYESANTRKSLARMRNRVRRDGRSLTVEVLSETGAILHALPRVLRAHRERDLQLRGWSMLDTDPARAHYVGVVRTLTDIGAIRLLLVRIDGELAAYVVAIVDGDTLRIYDNRIVPGYLDYSAGAIANSEILHVALADPELSVLDWGVGGARYKHSSATRSAPSRNLAAWSTGPVRSAWRAGLEVTRRARELRDLRREPRPVGMRAPG
jgi:CelD/BcsL family acetyltransferase involved in cellulose biosynthesis